MSVGGGREQAKGMDDYSAHDVSVTVGTIHLPHFSEGSLDNRGVERGNSRQRTERSGKRKTVKDIQRSETEETSQTVLQTAEG